MYDLLSVCGITKTNRQTMSMISSHITKQRYTCMTQQGDTYRYEHKTIEDALSTYADIDGIVSLTLNRAIIYNGSTYDVALWSDEDKKYIDFYNSTVYPCDSINECPFLKNPNLCPVPCVRKN